MARPASDPDSIWYGDDDPTWGEQPSGDEQFRAHTIEALQRVEQIMAKVTAWFDDIGLIYCRDCAKQAKEGGARLRQAQVGEGLVECAGCRRMIENEAKMWR